ncbi:MAG: uracil-DNA glycosylase family 4 [Rhodoferax sp.]|jgi:uracil-DNA glycosylase family 4
MSLDLDPRQRAMLQEMGVRVWLPATEVAAAVPVVREASLAVPAVAIRVEPPPAPQAIEQVVVKALTTGAAAFKAGIPPVPQLAVPVPTIALLEGLPEGLSAMDWPTLAQAVAACGACPLCQGRRGPVFGGTQVGAPRQADWLVVGDPPDEAEERAGLPFADQAGLLLDNMLKALGLSRASAYVTNVVKCRSGDARNPTPQELATCEHFLRREVALVQPKVILALGRFAAQTLLQASRPEVASVPLGKLRGQVYRYQGIPVVVSYHPTYLLLRPLEKARAWADLCLAHEALRVH